MSNQQTSTPSTSTHLPNHLPSPDDASTAAALELQLQDIQRLEDSNKGKNNMDQPSDWDMARELYHAELRDRAVFQADRLMAASIGWAVRADGNFLDACRAQERGAQSDHQLARRLEGLQGTAPTRASGPSQPVLPEPDDELIERLLRYGWGSGQDDEADAQAGPSSSLSSARPPQDQHPPVRTVVCEVCTEAQLFFDVSKLVCGHDYCGGCLRDLFTACLTDESLFPPRCCRQLIPLASVRGFIPEDLAVSFQGREVELTTPNRTYCSAPTCSTFIPPAQINGDRAACPACRAVTCTICKWAAHTGDCPQDTALQQLQTTAETNGWQRCFSCRRFVELDIGCNHITCRCGAQFCYVCGARWHTCICDLWNEQRLYHRAHQIAHRPANNPPRIVAGQANQPQPQPQPPVPAPAARVEAVAQELRDNDYYYCDHHWRYRPYYLDACEECGEYLNRFHFECLHCGAGACSRCRRNRL
ncbi:IBR finger domain protein [Aspergillus sp. HF37]|nr:IBR finger domain protein [Aspergillus sp. HF37]